MCSIKSEVSVCGIILPVSADEIFDFIVQVPNLRFWAKASDFSPSDDGWWSFTTPHGAARIKFHALRSHGILDHEYHDNSGKWQVPMRAVPHQRGSYLALTLIKPAQMNPEKFFKTTQDVSSELKRLLQYFAEQDQSS
ncbi:MAG: hypothetical protein KDD42_07225 [Bdellovibrionales bacterium]|nr:hypothetical protein [Bdellovibrionales bacterium]